MSGRLLIMKVSAYLAHNGDSEAKTVSNSGFICTLMWYSVSDLGTKYYLHTFLGEKISIQVYKSKLFQPFERVIGTRSTYYLFVNFNA